jgi:hypothetical protein
VNKTNYSSPPCTKEDLVGFRLNLEAGRRINRPFPKRTRGDKKGKSFIGKKSIPGDFKNLSKQ